MTTGAPPCPFCDVTLIESSTPIEHHSWHGYSVRVFSPLFPVTPGHLLVAPALHVQHAAEDPSITAATMAIASEQARRYPSSNLITSIGRAATQTVQHLHLHVVPRAEHDGLALPWDSGRPRITDYL